MRDDTAPPDSQPPLTWDMSLHQPSIWRYIAVVPTWLAATALFCMMVMTFADVLLRSILDNPIEAATELTRIFMAVIVFASLPLVSWKGGNIVVDLMDPLFSRRAAHLRDIVIDLLCGALLLWPAKRVFDLAERARDYGDTTEYLNMPQHYTGWFIAAFTGVTALALIARGITRIIAPEKVAP